MTSSGSLRVRDLYLYPLKSAAGIRVEAALLDAFGFVGDRRWMLVDANGRFISQREHARLALLRASFALPVLDESVTGVDQATPENARSSEPSAWAATAIAAPGLVLDAPGLSTLTVPVPSVAAGAARASVVLWDDTCDGLDAGDEPARWASEFLGEPCRLIYAPPDMVRRVDPVYAHADERTGFSDGFPLLLIGQGSLDDVNARLVAAGQAPVPMNRFRPNIVVDGGGAFAEDAWRRLAIGPPANPLQLDIVKPCARCSIIPVDQSTGVRGKEPLTTLSTYRRAHGKVFFGQNVLHRGLGWLRVGDAVQVLEEQPGASPLAASAPVAQPASGTRAGV